MKNLIKATFLIICCGFLVACLSPKDDESNLNEDHKTPEEEPANNQEENTNQNQDNEVNQDIENNENEEDTLSDNEKIEQDTVLMENDAFKIFEPSPESEISEDFTVRGLASVFEGNVNYEFEDGHFIMDEGVVTATTGAPEWGEFEFTVKIDDAVTGSASIVIFELSAKDGSRINELIIPIKINKEK